jgi:alpha-1,2-mannosyltransferase
MPVSVEAEALVSLAHRWFAWLYGVVGRQADVVMTNSTWTNNNIKALWRIPDRSGIVYPPCDTEGFMALPLTGDRLEGKVVSVAQFRPEKDHSLQVRRSWTSLLRSNPFFFFFFFWIAF